MANLTHARIVTPERVLFDGDAEGVTLRADGGDITFLANHADEIATVDVCVVRVDTAQSSGEAESTATGAVRAAVHGGYVKVADNLVTVVAGVAELGSDIDLDRARRALEAASTRQDEAATARARARLAAAGAAEL